MTTVSESIAARPAVDCTCRILGTADERRILDRECPRHRTPIGVDDEVAHASMKGRRHSLPGWTRPVWATRYDLEEGAVSWHAEIGPAVPLVCGSPAQVLLTRYDAIEVAGEEMTVVEGVTTLLVGECELVVEDAGTLAEALAAAVEVLRSIGG